MIILTISKTEKNSNHNENFFSHVSGTIHYFHSYCEFHSTIDTSIVDIKKTEKKTTNCAKYIVNEIRQIIIVMHKYCRETKFKINKQNDRTFGK